MKSDAPIGVFDSGIGGLTVVREIRQMLPGENIIYVGDTARVPYGSREPKEIVAFMDQILRFFAGQKVKMAVFACNTMTAYGYQRARGRCGYPLVPMNSAVQDAVAVAPGKRIGVVATEATVNNEMHKISAAQIDPKAVIHARACPAFVPLIEAGEVDGPKMEAAVKQYMEFFAGKGIEALILGCTHYPLIEKLLQKQVGPAVRMINPARATAKAAVDELQRQQLMNDSGEQGSLTMCFSGDLKQAARMTELVLGKNTAEFKTIDLMKY